MTWSSAEEYTARSVPSASTNGAAVGILVGAALPRRGASQSRRGTQATSVEASVSGHVNDGTQVTDLEGRRHPLGGGDERSDHAVGASSVSQAEKNEVPARARDQRADVGPAHVGRYHVARPWAPRGWDHVPIRGADQHPTLRWASHGDCLLR